MICTRDTESDIEYDLNGRMEECWCFGLYMMSGVLDSIQAWVM
jgi:hypothetical protein